MDCFILQGQQKHREEGEILPPHQGYEELLGETEGGPREPSRRRPGVSNGSARRVVAVLKVPQHIQ